MKFRRLRDLPVQCRSRRPFAFSNFFSETLTGWPKISLKTDFITAIPMRRSEFLGLKMNLQNCLSSEVWGDSEVWTWSGPSPTDWLPCFCVNVLCCLCTYFKFVPHNDCLYGNGMLVRTVCRSGARYHGQVHHVSQTDVLVHSQEPWREQCRCEHFHRWALFCPVCISWWRPDKWSQLYFLPTG